jgi:tetratricopeptide (TPR) repeat protein
MEQFEIMTRGGVLVVLSAFAAALAAPRPTVAQPTATPAPAPAAEVPAAQVPAVKLPPRAPSATAYFEFIRGRHLESLGQIPQALDAYRLAAEADPKSAVIAAEIATLNARANRTEDATRAAGQALAIDPDNAEAHWVLGTIFAAELEGRFESGRPGGGTKPTLDAAIAHLERARPSRPLDASISVTLGRLYLTKRDFAKSRALLEGVLEREPGHAEAAYLMAQAQIGAGDLDAAARSLDVVIAAEPQFTRALIDRADLALRQRRWDDAATAFGKAAAAMPERLDLKLRQASALLRGGKADAARDLLETIERDRGDDARVPFLLVDVERARHDYQRAERAARRVIELEPDRVTGYHALAQVLADRREHRAIVDMLAPAIARLDGKEDARSLVALRASIGVAHLQLREFDAGIAAIDRARRDGGADPGLDALRVQARLQADRVDEALTVVTEARREDPASQRLLGLEAETRMRRGERPQAFALYQQSIDADGSDVDTHIAFAGLLLEAKEFKRAETVLTAARARFPEETSIPFQLGAVFEEQARYEDAERAFRDALLIDPKHAPSLNYLGYMLAERGRKLDEAVKLLHEAVALDPYNGSYLDSLGWAYFKRGAYDQAKTYLMRAGDQLPRNSVIQDHVGDLLFAMSDRSGAVAAWRRALDGDGRSIERSVIEQKIEKARAR